MVEAGQVITFTQVANNFDVDPEIVLKIGLEYNITIPLHIGEEKLYFHCIDIYLPFLIQFKES